MRGGALGLLPPPALKSRRALPLTARGTNGLVLAKRCEKYIFASTKRGRAQAFPLFAFLGLTILYERKNYKQERENLLGDNFCDVL